MSDSQKFSVAAHALAYLAHKQAYDPSLAVSSAELATSISTNPVVVRRVTSMLGKAGLIGARPGASGGAWLKFKAEEIGLDKVLRAVNGKAHLGVAPKGVSACPVGARIPGVLGREIASADEAAAQHLSQTSIADLLAECSQAA